MPALMTGYLDELKDAVQRVVIGSAAQELLNSIMGKIEQHLDYPLRMYASATPDQFLNFNSNKVITGNGSEKTTPPADDSLQTYPATKLGFQGGGIVGGGTIKRDGATFAMPASVTGQFKRAAFVYKSDNTIDCTFSADFGSYAALPDPGTLYALLEGQQIGVIDLVGTSTAGTGTFKTASSAGSSVTSIIENAISSAPAIHNVGAAGGGGSAVKRIRLGSVSTPNATFKGGELKLASGQTLMTHDGGGNDTSNYGKDITASLTTLFGSSPANDTDYWTYIDYDTLGAEVTIATGSLKGKKVIKVTATNMVVLATSPTALNRARYIETGSVHSATTGNAWSGAGAGASSVSLPMYFNGPAAVSPIVYSQALRPVGQLGIPGHLTTKGILDFNVFPAGAQNTSKLSIFSLRGDSLDAYGSRNLTNNNTVAYTGYDQFEEGAVAAEVNAATKNYSSTNAFFNPGAGTSNSFAFGCWVRCQKWNDGTNRYFISQADAAGSDRSFDFFISSGQLRFRATNTAGSYDVDVTTSNLNLVNGNAYFFALVYDRAAQLMKMYVDGFQVSSTSVTNIRAATTANFRMGNNSVPDSPINGYMSDAFFHNAGGTSGALTEADLRKIAGKLTGVRQMAAAHVISSKSWPSNMPTTRRAWFSFLANATDGSGNSKDLTTSGSPSFAGIDYDGVSSQAIIFDGVDDHASSGDAFFNPGNGKSWAVGGWVAAADWTPGGSKALCGQMISNSDQAFTIFLRADGSIDFSATNTATSMDATVTALNPRFIDGSWHHIAMVYDYAAQELKAYIDGRLVGRAILANTRAISGTAAFRVGAYFTAAVNFSAFTGREWFFVNDYALSDADVQKIAGYRLDHSLATDAEKQKWSATVLDNHKYDDIDVIDKSDRNSVFLDMVAYRPIAQIEIKCADLGLSSNVVSPTPPFDQTYTVEPSFPLSHGLSGGGIPVLEIAIETPTSGTWEWLSSQGILTISSTQINGSIQTLLDNGATKVRIRARVGSDATGVNEFNTSRSGIVDLGYQEATGPKRIHTVGKHVDHGSISADQTLTLNDVEFHTYAPSGADRTINLPTGTAIVDGWKYRIRNSSSTQALVIKASGGEEVHRINVGQEAFIWARQANPTTATHWSGDGHYNIEDNAGSNVSLGAANAYSDVFTETFTTPGLYSIFYSVVADGFAQNWTAGDQIAARLRNNTDSVTVDTVNGNNVHATGSFYSIAQGMTTFRVPPGTTKVLKVQVTNTVSSNKGSVTGAQCKFHAIKIGP